MNTLTQMAVSTAPCQFSVNVIDAEGNPYNPSGDAVEVAFWAVTSPAAPFSPDTATWYPATWSVSPGPVYWVNFMPGPANGGINLGAGSFIVIGRVVDNPAIPLLQGCYLILT